MVRTLPQILHTLPCAARCCSMVYELFMQGGKVMAKHAKMKTTLPGPGTAHILVWIVLPVNLSRMESHNFGIQ